MDSVETIKTGFRPLSGKRVCKYEVNRVMDKDELVSVPSRGKGYVNVYPIWVRGGAIVSVPSRGKGYVNTLSS